MRRVFEYIYEKEESVKISDFLKEKRYSSSLLTSLRHREGAICCNGEVVHMNRLLECGDTIRIVLEDDVSLQKIVSSGMRPDIIYEDEDILVVNKPAGMPVHPSLNHYDDTLANAVIGYYESKNEKCIFRCITRLDRDTSGVTLLAKNELSALLMSEDMRDGCIDKEYLAVVEGITDESGIIDAPIARRAESMVERIVDTENGKEARTEYTRIKTIEREDMCVSLLRIKLYTGRTHQIRVHMKHIGHPLVGDFLYNPTDRENGRQLLHCSRLMFNHPITHEKMEFVACMPNDMQTLMGEGLS